MCVDIYKIYFCHDSVYCYNIGLNACFHFKSHAIDNHVFKRPCENSVKKSHGDT